MIENPPHPDGLGEIATMRASAPQFGQTSGRNGIGPYTVGAWRPRAHVLGLRDKSPGTQIGALIGELSSNPLSLCEKKGSANVRLLSGQTCTFFPAGVVGEVALGIIESALQGRLHPKRQHLVTNCRKILSVLATTGAVALIPVAASQ